MALRKKGQEPLQQLERQIDLPVFGIVMHLRMHAFGSQLVLSHQPCNLLRIAALQSTENLQMFLMRGKRMQRY